MAASLRWFGALTLAGLPAAPVAGQSSLSSVTEATIARHFFDALGIQARSAESAPGCRGSFAAMAVRGG